MFTELLSHWPLLIAVGFVALAILNPALLTFEAGRTGLLLGLIAAGVLWVWTSRYEDGRAAERTAAKARETHAALVAEGAARMKERDAVIRMDLLATNYEKARHESSQAAYTRALDDVRYGRVRLRDVWGADLSCTAATPAERDAAAQRRVEAAGRAVRIGAESDAQLAACQAVVRQYQELRP